MPAERAVIRLNESAMRKVMRDRRTDTPVKPSALAFLK
jgi:hypothetical protein